MTSKRRDPRHLVKRTDNTLSVAQFVRMSARMAGVHEKVELGQVALVDGAAAAYVSLQSAGFDFDSRGDQFAIRKAVEILENDVGLHSVMQGGQLVPLSQVENGQVIVPGQCRPVGGSPGLASLNMRNRPRSEDPSAPKPPPGYRTMGGLLAKATDGADVSALQAADIKAREDAINEESAGRVRQLEADLARSKKQVTDALKREAAAVSALKQRENDDGKRDPDPEPT